MTLERLRVLLAEDSLAIAETVRVWLEGKGTPRLEVHHVETLHAARCHLREERTDCVLLDLTLPDSAGLDTLAHVLAVAPDVPVVVLTGASDPGMAIGAVRLGAQDYLFKGHIRAASLRRVVVYAVERRRRERAVVEAVDASQIHPGLERLASAFDGAPHARDLPLRPLRERSTESFASLAERYVCLLDAEIGDSSAARRERTGHLVAIGDTLAALRASPRDLLDLHASALAAHQRLAWPEDEVDAREALLFELLGHMAAAYRRIALEIDGARPASPSVRPAIAKT